MPGQRRQHKSQPTTVYTRAAMDRHHRCGIWRPVFGAALHRAAQRHPADRELPPDRIDRASRHLTRVPQPGKKQPPRCTGEGSATGHRVKAGHSAS
jgi:hypothetical protein